MSYFSLAAILAFSNLSPLSGLPSCGEAAAYAYSRVSGDSAITVDQISQLFDEFNPELDRRRISVSAIRQVLKCRGLETVAIRIKSRLLHALPLPAILHLLSDVPTQDDTASEAVVGHYIVLIDLDSDGTAIYFDWDALGTIGVQRAKINTIESRWSGNAVVSSSSVTVRRQLSLASWSLLIAAVVFSFFIIIRSFPRSAIVSLQFAVLGLVSLAGCAQRVSAVPEETADSPLEILQPFQDLGIVTSMNAFSISVPFNVWSKSSVRIDEIATCCGVFHKNTELIGKELAPGTAGQIDVNADVPFAAGPVTRTIRLSTSPKSAAPLIVVLRFVHAPKPSPSHDKLRLVQVASGEFIGELVLSTRRHHNTDRQMKIDMNASGSETLRIVSSKTVQIEQSINSATGQREFIDKTMIRVSMLNQRRADKSPATMQLLWANGMKQEIPVEIVRFVPFDIGISRIHTGVLKPGQRWEWSTRCKSGISRQLESGVFSTSLPFVNARFNPQQQRIEIELTAPEQNGRYEGDLVFTSSSTTPPVVLPFSCIVQSEN